MQTNGNTALQPDHRYTLKDYRSWGEAERWELISGIAYSMSPAPRVLHQRLVLAIGRQLASFFSGKPCETLIAPVDLYITGSDSDECDTVVQPDLMVVCNPELIQDAGVYGAPDFICEILSPATAWKDQTEKRNLYERYGVKEYWVLHPDTLDLLIYQLDKGVYRVPRAANLKEPVAVELFPGLVLTIMTKKN